LPQSGGGGVTIAQFFGFPIYVDYFLRTLPCNYPAVLKAKGPPYPPDTISTLRTGFGMNFQASDGYSPSGNYQFPPGSGTIYSTSPGIDWNAIYSQGQGDTGTICTISVKPTISYPYSNQTIFINNVFQSTGGFYDFIDSCSTYFVVWTPSTITSSGIVYGVTKVQLFWKGFHVFGNWGTEDKIATLTCTNSQVGACPFSSLPETTAPGWDFQNNTGFDTIHFDPCDFVLALDTGKCGPTDQTSSKTVGLNVKTKGPTTTVTITYLGEDCLVHSIIFCFKDGLFVGVEGG
jgi:hypothetical protein